MNPKNSGDGQEAERPGCDKAAAEGGAREQGRGGSRAPPKCLL